ncbi:MAG: hypothetical protein QME35_08570 [Thermoanaerobacteraceae bacterium]|jgi:hypothetical protein|nr:hypothetical protein [Thermoanaerobacteraceae bacterium]
MNKKFAILILSMVFTFTVISPSFAAVNQQSVVDDQVDHFSPNLNMATEKDVSGVVVTPQSKGSITIKLIRKAIEKVYPKLPYWFKRYIPIDTAVKAIDHYLGIEGEIENAIYKGIRDVAPSWVPNSAVWFVTKTITLVLPI